MVTVSFATHVYLTPDVGGGVIPANTGRNVVSVGSMHPVIIRIVSEEEEVAPLTTVTTKDEDIMINCLPDYIHKPRKKKLPLRRPPQRNANIMIDCLPDCMYILRKTKLPLRRPPQRKANTS